MKTVRDRAHAFDGGNEETDATQCNAGNQNANDLENFDLQQCCLFVSKNFERESTFIELLIRIAETRPELAKSQCHFICSFFCLCLSLSHEKSGH